MRTLLKANKRLQTAYLLKEGSADFLPFIRAVREVSILLYPACNVFQVAALHLWVPGHPASVQSRFP